MGFRPTRWRFDAPRVFVRRAVARDLAVACRPSLRFRAPSETCHSSPAPQRRPTAGPEGPTRDPPRDAASPGVSCPTTQSRIGGSASMAADPSATACHVRGLATSFAASTTGPTGARSAGASLGLALQGVPLVAIGAPLGVPALLTLPPASPPEGEQNRSGRLQGLVPATNPFRRHPPPEGRERPPMPSWAFPLQSILLNHPGDRF